MSIDNFLQNQKTNLVLTKILPLILGFLSFIKNIFPIDVHWIIISIYVIMVLIVVISFYYYHDSESKLNIKIKDLNTKISKLEEGIQVEIDSKSKLSNEIIRSSKSHKQFKGGLIEFIRTCHDNFQDTAENVINTKTLNLNDWSLSSIGYDICMHCCNFLSAYGEITSSQIGVGIIEYVNGEFELVAHSGEGAAKETFQTKISEKECKYYYKKVHQSKKQIILVDNKQINREFKRLWKELDTTKFKQYIAIPSCDKNEKLHGVMQIMITGNKNLADDLKELEELVDKYLNIYINMILMIYTAGNEIKRMLSIEV